MSDRLSREKFKTAIAATSTAALVIGGLTTVIHYSLTDPVRAFERSYTAEGHCLDNSPYDRDAGAGFMIERTLGDSAIAVVAGRANIHKPSVLDFDAKTTGLFTTELRAADDATIEFLAQKCDGFDLSVSENN